VLTNVAAVAIVREGVMTNWFLAFSIFAAGAVVVAAYVFLIRPRHLRWGATAEEAISRLPGDDLVPDPRTEATHAVTIDARPEDVWPWLVQLGQDRAGFYSYAWLENLFGCRMRNTYRIVPEWQHLAAGDGVLFHPKLPRVPVAALEPNRFLVLGGLLDPETGLPATAGADPATCGATGWAFVLRADGEGRIRLIVRLRGRWPDGLRGWLANRLLWEPAHFVMERRMLRTVKRLAEAASRASEQSSGMAADGHLVRS
jgi:hypothetical protein